ncbi:hypothetical protein HO133_010256 [Letharia lupina]|uniref:Uncharacterized protein n=1 Tax=Letharia lupina TaxID=560253 RepID=A0A8H6CL21_9LECA|nr:uncharacterized protein HO133_010256 [Letharia lupina]KAF6225061.1 hypothetical protein HO133_010256 [Letharia lupina]
MDKSQAQGTAGRNVKRRTGLSTRPSVKLRRRDKLGIVPGRWRSRFSICTPKQSTWCPGRIEKTGTTWLIHPGVYTGTSQLMPFPYERVPDVHDQEALLTYQSCSTAVSEMHNVVKILLRGLYPKVDEVSRFLKGAVLSNAGGRVNADALRSIVVLDSMAGVGTVMEKLTGIACRTDGSGAQITNDIPKMKLKERLGSEKEQ